MRLQLAGENILQTNARNLLIYAYSELQGGNQLLLHDHVCE